MAHVFPVSVTSSTPVTFVSGRSISQVVPDGPKAHASVRAANHAVIGTYEARGYQVEDSAQAVTLDRGD